MKTLYIARYFFICALLLLAGGVAWRDIFRDHGK
jgi:hypothetical protein